MKHKNFFMTAALSMLMVGAVQAQDTRGALKSYSIVEAQGGVQLTATDVKMDKLITPTAALSIGHFFSPVVGARLHVNAWESKSGFSDIDKYYKWKYITPDLDLLVNLTNLFSKKSNNLLNVMLIGGVGLTYAWDNDELKDLKMPANRIPLAWDDNRLSHNIRAGLRLETDVTKPFGVSLEVNANSKDDRFNSKTNDADDWQFTAMLGLSFRFGHRYSKPAPAPVPVVEEIVEEPVAVVAPAPVVVKQKVKKEVTREEPAKLHKEVFYAIRVSANETPSAIMEQVAQFIKENKNVKVNIVGYADKGTGNARVNKMYAAKRADQFKKDLVNRHGVDASIITTDSKGDTVQPFAENDKNRCVIIDAEGIKVVKETIEVEE
ncbi:MAG: OmpA family protein [Prevotella sp.]|jgi:outer membrane protein OmpA-like peptidoglycan-associated protein|nr:OmpA family protein [Prevotella sp.]